MFVISRITQRYDAEQDRVCLTAEDGRGRVLLLWLTQRLAVRLAQALARWLEEEVKSAAGGRAGFTLHAWEQSAARAQLRPARPVAREAAQGEALVNAVDLARSAKGYTLTFKWGGGGGKGAAAEGEAAGAGAAGPGAAAVGAARLTMTSTELRQWLLILRGQFAAGGWPLDVWPAWVAAEADAKPGGPSPLLH